MYPIENHMRISLVPIRGCKFTVAVWADDSVEECLQAVMLSAYCVKSIKLLHTALMLYKRRCTCMCTEWLQMGTVFADMPHIRSACSSDNVSAVHAAVTTQTSLQLKQGVVQLGSSPLLQLPSVKRAKCSCMLMITYTRMSMNAHICTK